MVALFVIAETISVRFEITERLHFRLLLRCVTATRSEGNCHVVPGVFGRLLNRGAPTENDHVSERYSLISGLSAVELFLNAFKFSEHCRKLSRVVDFPI